MKTFSFTRTEWEEYGMIGWKPDWWEGATPAIGLGVAHDVLEHVAGWGSFEQEMAAFGCMLHQRVNGGYWEPPHSYGIHGDKAWVHHTAGDIARMFGEHIQDEEQWIKPCTRVHKVFLEDWLENLITQATLHGFDQAQEEYESFSIEDTKTLLTNEHAEGIKRALRIGYRASERRFKCAEETVIVFRDIQKTVDMEIGEVEIGTRMEIDVNYNPVGATVRLIESDLHDV